MTKMILHREGRDENYLCTANTQIARTMHAFFEQEITERTERRVVSASVDSVCSCSKSVCLVAAAGRAMLFVADSCGSREGAKTRRRASLGTFGFGVLDLTPAVVQPLQGWGLGWVPLPRVALR